MVLWGAPIAMSRAARRRRYRQQRCTWVREILSPAEARAVFPRLWEVADAVVPSLTDDQLARVVSLVVDTCSSCYQDNAGCGCGRGARAAARADPGAVLTVGQRRMR